MKPFVLRLLCLRAALLSVFVGPGCANFQRRPARIALDNVLMKPSLLRLLCLRAALLSVFVGPGCSNFQRHPARNALENVLLKPFLLTLICLRVALLSYLVGPDCTNFQRHPAGNASKNVLLKPSLHRLLCLRAAWLSVFVGLAWWCEFPLTSCKQCLGECVVEALLDQTSLLEKLKICTGKLLITRGVGVWSAEAWSVSHYGGEGGWSMER